MVTGLDAAPLVGELPGLDPEELDRLAAELAGDPLTLDLDPLWIELPPLPEVEEGPLPEVDP